MAWNRPTSNTVDATSSSRPSGRGKMPRLRRGLLAGAIVVALGSAALWFFSGNEARQDAASTKGRGRIKEVKPAVAPTNAVPAKPVDPREDYDHTKMYRDENGLLRWNTGCIAPDPTRKVLPTLVVSRLESPHIFSNSFDRALNALLTRRPGSLSIAKRNYYSESFQAAFIKSLTDPVKPNENDSPRTKQLKQAVLDAKKEISARIKAGENLGDILTEADNELKRLHQYQHDLRKQVNDLVKKGEYSTQDVKDLVAAANDMLEKKGLNPIREDSIIIENLRLTAERNGANPDAAEAAYEESKATTRQKEGKPEK